MKYFWRRFLALIVGLGLTAAVVADPPGNSPPQWGTPAQPAAPRPDFQPVSYNPGGPQPLVPFDQPRRTTPTVTLARPVPIVENVPLPEPLPNPLTDAQVQPTGFSGQGDPVTGRSIQMNPAAGQLSAGMFNWKPLPTGDDPKKSIETGPAPKPEPLPTPPAPVPGSMPVPLNSGLYPGLPGGTYLAAPIIGTGPISSGPVLSGPIVSGPIGSGPIVSGPVPMGQTMPQPPMVGPPGACPPAACTTGNCFGMPAACGGPMCPEMVDGGGGCYTPWSCFYFSAEYLLWFARGAHAPPLATTGPATSPIPGGGGQEGTLVLNNTNILDGIRSGARFNLGLWFDDAKCFGLDTSFFFLGKTSDNFAVASTGNFELARPLTLVGTGQEFTEVTASSVAPMRSSGSIAINNNSQLSGWEASFRTNLLCWQNCYMDLLVGYRGMVLNENTDIVEFVNSREPTAPGSFLIHDGYHARNDFNGGQIGFVGEKRFWDAWTFDWKAKIALGSTREHVDVTGTTLITGSGTSDGIYQTGILAQGNYLGGHTRNIMTYVPEVQFDLGYQINPHLRAFVGYNFIYWSNVARASEQISRVNNPNLFAPPVAGATNPAPFSFNGSGYWAQGVNLGLEFRW